MNIAIPAMFTVYNNMIMFNASYPWSNYGTVTADGHGKASDCIECGMSPQGVEQESSRCLRCDHFGYGIFKGGRTERW